MVGFKDEISAIPGTFNQPLGTKVSPAGILSDLHHCKKLKRFLLSA
jgi:hypothetical protein